VYRESSRRSARIILQREIFPQRLLKRSNTVSAGRGALNVVKFAISGVLATGVAIGTALFYAGRDEKVRDEVEKAPFAKEVLSSMYGERKTKQDPGFTFAATDIGKREDQRPLEKPLTASVENAEAREEDLVLEVNDELTVEDTPQNKVVVITTIDDQAAVSSVDLDIGNPAPQSKKKKKKKINNRNEKKTDHEEKAEGNSAHRAIDDNTVAVSSGKEAFEVINDSQNSTSDASDTKLQDPAVDATSEATLMTENEEDEIHGPSHSLMTDGSTADKSFMETALKNLVIDLKVSQDAAIQKHAYASEKLREYGEQLAKAMSVDIESKSFDDEWKAASDLEQISQALVDDAKDSELKVQSSVEAIYKLIKGLREIGSNDVAELAQENATAASLEMIRVTDGIKKASEKLSDISGKGLVKEDDAIRELSPLLNGNVDMRDAVENGKAASNVMLTYAMKKIEYLKKDLENLRIEEDNKLKQMIQEVKKEEEKKTELQLTTQEEKLKRDFEVLVQKKEADLLEEFEVELRKQLKRQSAAHREHLADVLEAHTNRLDAEHKTDLEEKLCRERLVHGREISKVVSHLRGIESIIDLIGDAEKKSRRTQELWLAVQSLSSVLSKEAFSGRTRSLLPEITSIVNLAGSSEAVKCVIEAIPESAAVQGVSTEDGLKKRFENVKRVCKRVAMIGENESSLWTYVLSAVRSFVVFETHAKRDIVNEVDPNTISPYEILAKAQHCMEEGNLELAVKFMSLLRGLPKKLAGDWLREARMYLETKQASEFLLAYAASEVSHDH